MKAIGLWIVVSLSSANAAEPIIECEVTSVTGGKITMFCDDGKIRDIPLSHWQNFLRNWPEPIEGLKVKAVRSADGLHSVADCETRMREAIDAYCGGACNCAPPINSLTPDDCR